MELVLKLNDYIIIYPILYPILYYSNNVLYHVTQMQSGVDH
jgi:hypothetical protein